MKKKIFALLIIVILVFSFVSCNDTTENTEDNKVVAEENKKEEPKEENKKEEPKEEKTENKTEEAKEEENVQDEGIDRKDVAEKYKWNLSDIYENEAAFDADVNYVESSYTFFREHKKDFTASYNTFLEVFKKFEEVRRKTDKLYVFATLQSHTDTEDSHYSDLVDIATKLDADLNLEIAYFSPSIINMDQKVLTSYINKESFKEFKPYVDDILEMKDHILGNEAEEIIAKAKILFKLPESIYEAYVYNTDLSKYLPEPDLNKFWFGTREDKIKVIEDLYKKTEVGNDLLAAIYEAEIKKNTFFAQASNFENALDMALFSDGVTKEEYNKIFEITHKNLDKLHKWISLKKKVLKLEEYHFFDAYTPLVSASFETYTPEKALDYINKALEPLGEKYLKDFNEGFNNRWADVYPTKNKYQGAYQWGTYDTHPFVLLNYNETLEDVSTLAHEMGHAINFKYTNEAQPYFASNIPIFNAEIASTTNESLIYEYRIKSAETKKEKQNALVDYISLIENTIYVQMLYADFEKRVYEAYDNDIPLNTEFFNHTMRDVLKEYYGKDFTVDEVQTYQWSEVPHFFNAFYVYKYATGLSAGINFSSNILNGTTKDRDLYLDYLKSGSSDNPVELLRKAGVDFRSGYPLENAYKRFGELIDEFEKTLE